VNGPCEEDGSYFLDRDGLQFLFIMNYLRNGPETFVPPDTRTARLTLAVEAKMLRLYELADLLEKAVTPMHSPLPSRLTYALGEGDTYFGAPIPKNEVERIAKLRSLEVLDTQNTETEYDLITRICAAIIGVPIVLVSLVAEDKQWFKSRCGLPANETPREMSFCAYTLVADSLEDAAVLIVTDARRDLRFMRNPLVLGEPYIQFYCGVPLITSEGLRMGSLCSIDNKPRDVTPKELGLQINFAYLVVQALEGTYLEGREEMPTLLEDAKEEHFLGGPLREKSLKDTAQTAICLVWARPDSMEWMLLYGNQRWTDLTGVEVIPPSRFPGKAELRWKVEHSWPSVLGTGESFWDHVRMDQQDSQHVLELWKVVSAAMQGQHPETQNTGFASVVCLKAPCTATKYLSCRFTPAELPLGAAAAVVKNYGLTGHSEKWPRPKGFAAEGHWFFVQMQAEENILPEQPEEPPPMPRSQTDPTSEPLRLSCFRDDDEPLNRKPPTPPFQDVRLVRLVGQGSFGCVYFSLWSGAAVACKVIKTLIPKKTTLEDVKSGPRLEAILSERISHPNLVQTFKHGERVNENVKMRKSQQIYETWIVQEWCDRGTLHGSCKEPRLESEGLLEALEILIEICRAGLYLHDIGLIHGDLTSNNVLLKSMPVAKGFVCKVCDFGLARVLEGDDDDEIRTNSLGTLSHMPPEVMTSIENAARTKKTDVYSLGIIAFTVLTAKQPFTGLTAPQVVIQVSRGKRPVLPDSLPAELLSAYQSILLEAPEERPTFGELVDAFSKIYKDLGGEDDEEALFHSEKQRNFRAKSLSIST